MTKYICIVAPDGGRIGPGSDAVPRVFDTYLEALAFMDRDIEERGGGECNFEFGNGYAEGGEIAYEIFGIVGE